MPSGHRHASLEVLRSAAALAVVGVHVAAMLLVARPGANDSQWWAANLWGSFFHWCVPVFVMLSGALLLDGAALPAGEFWRRRLGRLAWPLLGWSLIYLALSAAQAGAWSWSRVAASLWHGTPYYHLWYLWMLPGLYLAVPALRWLVVCCSRRQLWVLTLGWGALAALDAVYGWRGTSFLTSSLPYPAYLLLGHLLYSRRGRAGPAALWGVLLLSTLLVAWGAGALRPLLGERALTLMFAYPNPLLALMGASVFLLALRLDADSIGGPAKLAVRLAPLSFGIYLIHPLWLLGLQQLGVSGALWHPAIGIPLVSLLGFSLSALSTAALRRVPGFSRLVR